MFPSAALNSTQLEKLRGTASADPTYSVQVHLSLCPNVVVWKTTLSSAPTTSNFASLSYGSTLSGNLANVVLGMTVFIGAVDDIRQATFKQRVRVLPSGGVLGIGESSAALTSGMFVWVVQDFALWEKLARDTGSAYFKDWSLTYTALPPVITNLQSAYAGFVSGSPSGLTIAFSASAYAATQGASISSWAWSVPSGATLTAGSATSATPTYRFDAGFANWISVTVTDSGGRTTTRRIFVAAHDTTSNAPKSGFSAVSVNADLQNGINATLTAFDATEWDSVLDNTLCVLWVTERYNGVAGALDSGNNVVGVGRLRTENIRAALEDAAGVVPQVQLEIEGIGAQLARLHAPRIAMRDVSAPAVWDEVNTLTLWRAVIHVLATHTTLLNLCDVSFSDTSNTYRVQQLATQDGNMLSCINDILDSINAQFEFAPGGALRAARDPRYLSSAARAGLATRIGYTHADYTSVNIQRQHIFTVGRCEGSGGTYNSAGNQVTPLLSLAPGSAQASGEGQTTLARQVLQANVSSATAQQELNERTGQHLALNNTAEVLSAVHLDGYRFVLPSNLLWYTFAIPAQYTARGIAYAAQRWLCTQASLRFEDNGTCAVSATYTLETSGAPGITIRFPAPGAIPFEFPEFPPIDAYPGIGIIEPIDEYLGGEETPIDTVPSRLPLKRDGNTVAIWDASEIYYTVNFLTGGNNPEWVSISPDVPSGGTIRAFVWDTFSEAGAYCIVDDTTDTTLYYAADVRDLDWQLKNTFEGIYDVLRLTDTAGSAVAYTARNLSATTIRQTLVATFDPGSAAYNILSGALYGGGNPGDAWGDELAAAAPLTGGSADAAIDIPLPSGASGVSMSFDFKHGTDAGGAAMAIACHLKDSLGNQILGAGPSGMAGFRTTDNTTANVWRNESVTFTPGTKSGAAFAFFSVTWGRANGEQRSVYMDNCSVTFDASIGAGARAVFLSNYGANTTYVPVGTAVSDTIGGFAVQPVGTHTYAAVAAQVRESATLGGTYSDDGAALTSTAPRLLVIPTHVFTSSATKNTGANPDYLVGSGALVSSEALWRDDGSRTAITPVVSSNSGLSISPNCAAMWRGARIAALLSFGGTRRLVTTTNTGGAWSDRGAQDAAANHIRILPASKNGNELFWANNTHVRYSPDFGVTIRTKATPFSSGLLGVEVL